MVPAVGISQPRRWRDVPPEERAAHLARRKQAKRERKERGVRAASSGGSCSGSSAGDGAASDDSSGPETPPSGSPRGSPAPALQNKALPGTDAQAQSGPPTLYTYRPHVRAREEAIDSRVRGADLYVVRLLQDAESKGRAKEQRRRRAGAPPSGRPLPDTVEPRYADSRPCWRCLEWMHWAGIKRVYWTNTDAQWEGGKVSELLFGGPGGSCANAASAPGQEPGVMPGLVSLHMTQYEQAAAAQRAQRHAGTV